MNRAAFEAISNRAIIQYADDLEQYSNDIAAKLESCGCDFDIIGYTYSIFEKIDQQYWAVCDHLFSLYERNFDGKNVRDKTLFGELNDKLERIKEKVIEFKYEIMDVFVKASKRRIANRPKTFAVAKRYAYIMTEKIK